MSKKVVIISVIFAVTALTAYIFFFRPSCRSYSVKDGVVSVDDGETCNVAVKQCSGFNCMAPLIPIECGQTRDICGEQIFCECNQ